MVDHPEWTRPCASCEVYHEAGGRKTLRTTLTGSLREPPCLSCPKIVAGRPASPDTGRELDAPAWADVLRWYLRGKAVGFSPAPGEAIPEHLEDLAAVLAAFLSDRERQEAALRAAKKHVPRPAAWVLDRVAFG